MKVAELWRYPVKSVGGERLATTVLGVQGIAGDRALAVRDDLSGEVTWAGEAPALMRLRAVTSAEGLVSLAAPDGAMVTDDVGLLSAAAGSTVSLVDHQPPSVMHLLSTASLRSLARALPDVDVEVTRFRPNILVDVDSEGFPEHEWIGKSVRVGEARLRITGGCVRCVVINQATLRSRLDKRVLQWVAQNLRNVFGVYAEVEAPGVVAEGDNVSLVD